MTMEYLLPIAIFLMVLSPLFIPVGVTIVHTVRNWRPRVPALHLALVRRRQRLQLAVELA
jgi:hypothetical protein